MNIRKSVLTGVLAVSALSLFAQEQKEKEVEFAPHWYMQIQAGAGSTIGEAKFSKLISPAAALNFGYQFNPLFGLRFGASGWQGKGGWVTPEQDYKFKYVQGNVDAVLSLSDLFCKFNPQRTFNAYAFLGAGFNHAFDNEAKDLTLLGDHKLEYLWNDSKNFLVGRGGLGANVRLSDRVALNLEANANILSDKFNSKKAGNSDWQFNALVGLTIKLGKGHRAVAPVYVAPPAPAEEPKPVVEPKREEPKPVVVAEKKVEPYRCDIFFKINSSVIMENENAKINELVAYLKEYPKAQVAITGYADAGTGNEKINMRLSQERAQVVKEAIIKAGVDASRIVADHKGDNEQPFAVNDQNRVTICIAE